MAAQKIDYTKMKSNVNQKANPLICVTYETKEDLF